MCTLSLPFRFSVDPYDFSDIHESNDTSKDPIAMGIGLGSNSILCGSFVTVPGTELGAGYRVNLNRPSTQYFGIYPVLSVGQWVDISEVSALWKLVTFATTTM